MKPPDPEIGPSIIWSRAALALVAGVFALNVYRAITQSITIDEAFNYHNFVSKPIGGLLEPYDANNHVLNSLLSWLSIMLFGLSEWSLRLPSVIAGAMYLYASYRICIVLYGIGVWSLITTALLVTDPFLLDHLSAARGYGMALAFLLLALYRMVLAINDTSSKHLYLAGVFCGLAVAANLTSVFPVAGFGIAFIAVTLAHSRLSRDLAGRLQSIWSSFIVPATIISFVFVIIPLSKASPDHFYFGSKRLLDSVYSLADLSFLYGPFWIPWFPSLRRYTAWVHEGALWASVFLVVGAALCSVWYLRPLLSSGKDEKEEKDLRLCLFCLALLTIVALIVAAHVLAGLLYPLTRTGLYFIPLAILTASLILYRHRSNKLASYSAAVIGSLCLALFLAQLNTSYYAEWQFDAGTKRVAQFIRTHSAPDRTLVVRASWVLEPSLNFYRVLYHLNWAPLDRSPVDRAAGIRVLTPEDQGWIQRLNLKVIFKDTVSGAVVTLPQ